MKMRFGLYAAAWAVLLALFNLIVFIVPAEDKFTAGFWTGYSLITVTMLGMLACGYFAFRTERNA